MKCVTCITRDSLLHHIDDSPRRFCVSIIIREDDDIREFMDDGSHFRALRRISVSCCSEYDNHSLIVILECLEDRAETRLCMGIIDEYCESSCIWYRFHASWYTGEIFPTFLNRSCFYANSSESGISCENIFGIENTNKF